jgi:hypothetical protein
MKALRIEKMPICQCPLTSKKGRSPIAFCVSECVVLCDKFLRFDYILSKCFDSGCSKDMPCPACLEKIRAHKTFYRIIQIARIGANTSVETLEHRAAIYLDRRNSLSGKKGDKNAD